MCLPKVSRIQKKTIRRFIKSTQEFFLNAKKTVSEFGTFVRNSEFFGTF